MSMRRWSVQEHEEKTFAYGKNMKARHKTKALIVPKFVKEIQKLSELVFIYPNNYDYNCKYGLLFFIF